MPPAPTTATLILPLAEASGPGDREAGKRQRTRRDGGGLDEGSSVGVGLLAHWDPRSLEKTSHTADSRPIASASARAIAAATAEGYPFPANLDRAPPVSGMAPPSQQDLLRTAMAEEWGPGRFRRALDGHSTRRLSH